VSDLRKKHLCFYLKLYSGDGQKLGMLEFQFIAVARGFPSRQKDQEFVDVDRGKIKGVVNPYFKRQVSSLCVYPLTIDSSRWSQSTVGKTPNIGNFSRFTSDANDWMEVDQGAVNECEADQNLMIEDSSTEEDDSVWEVVQAQVIES